VAGAQARRATKESGEIPMNLFVLRTWLQAKFTRDENGERGASMVEYILLVALIALAVMAAVVFMRSNMQDSFSDAGDKVSRLPYDDA
jgi:Flp pilus assembly pilin Flp